MKKSLRLLFIIFLLITITNSLAQAQSKKPQNMPDFDKDIIHFGFLMGLSNADFTLSPVKDFHIVDTMLNISPGSSSGFSLGIVSDLHISNNFDLRFLPTLSFIQRDLFFSLKTNGTETTPIKKTIESTLIDLPIDLKFKSNRINNYRVYLIGGFKYAIDLASKKNDKNAPEKQPVKLENSDYGYEVGAGFDFYLPYVKLSPEIKMFNGLKNLLVKDQYVYSSTLDKINSKIFTLTLTIEGGSF